MSRPKTAGIRPSTSAGQLGQSFRPNTSSGTPADLGREDQDDSSKEYLSTDESEKSCQLHRAEADDDEDDVFAFAPPGLTSHAVEVIPNPAVVPTRSEATSKADPHHSAEGGGKAGRESIYYYDQASGAVYDFQGRLVQVQEPGPLPMPVSTNEIQGVRSDEQKPNAAVQRSTSIKWHPSTRQDDGTLSPRCESSGKESQEAHSTTSSYHDATSFNSQSVAFTPWSDSIDLLGTLPRPSFSRVVELELEEEDDSPYPEVRASVSNVDDPSMPSITFRSVVLGMVLSAFASMVNTVLSQRNPPLQIVAIIIQILAHPLGTMMANVLPIRSFTFRLPCWRKRSREAPSAGKAFKWSFNPGPWNIKEHTVVLVAATTGLNISYSLSILLAQDLPRFWDDRRSFLYGFLSVCAPQLVGLALSGYVREILVEPASMIWPQDLAIATVLNTLHAEEDSVAMSGIKQISRIRFFNLASLLAFVVYFFPGYLFTALSIFNWVCWIWPNNVPVNVVFGTTRGLGASFLTFDWTQIVLLGSPLIMPWWAQANMFGGFVLGLWIAAPILYFTNTLHTAYLPIISAGSFDRFGHTYNVSIVSPDHTTLWKDAYAAYSQVYISAGLVVAYFGGFALITAAVVHTALYHGHSVWSRSRARRSLPDDVHARLMRRYTNVPYWWYAVVLSIGLGMSVFLTAGYSTKLPIWALGLAFLLSAAYLVPFGFIFAMSGLPAAVNLVSELLASWLIPGKPLPVMMFKTISQQTTTFGLLFAQDQKLAHYMKVAPRNIFFIQVLSIFVNSVMQIVAKDFLRDRIQGVCDPNQPQRFTCPTVNIFYTASIIWGAIGVERSFGPKSPYHPLFYGLVVGATVPLITWYASRKLNWAPLKAISTPIIFVGMSLSPPATGINFTSAIVVGFFFQYWMRKHRVHWWSRYNFVLAGALDFGTVLSSIVIYFLLEMPKDGRMQLKWWGNQVQTGTADAHGTPLLVAPKLGFAPPPGAS
ncbi:putative Oligopeptide transporter 1 (putative) [Pseudozyma hubeiensis]|nr:putative Oligopeptide transporter 1 (putative) [Pseudozyma hubeiensis]